MWGESNDQQGTGVNELLNHIPVGIGVFEIVDGRVYQRYMNDWFYKLVADQKESRLARLGGDFMQAVYEEDRSFIHEAVQRIVQGSDDEVITCRMVTGNNDLQWIRSIVSVSKREGNRILIYSSHSSMSEEIEARRRLEQQYQTKLSTMEKLDTANLLVKGRSNITQNTTEMFVRKSEYAVEEKDTLSYEGLIQKLSQTVPSDSERRRVLETFDRRTLMENYKNDITEGELRYRRYAGDEVIWCETRYALQEEPSSHDLIAFVYSYDVTDTVIGEQILHKVSEVEYDLMGLFDVRTDTFVVKNIQKAMKVSLFEERGCYSKKCEELITRFIVETDRDMARHNMSIANVVEQLKTQDVYEFTYSSNIRGKRRRKKMQYTYLDELKNTVLYFKSDITALYENEREQLRKTEEALIEAEQANHARSDFFARMSHDMRTPMNGILGMTELSKEINDVAELHHNLEQIESSGTYLLNLINDILDLQKIETGKMEIRYSIVRCDRFIENIVDMMMPTAKQKKIDFQVVNKNIDLNRYAKMDVLRLKQVFVNIMSNAVKFTPEGGKILFTMEDIAHENGIDYDRFEIIDTGIGMSEEFLNNRIFNPYSQEQNSTTTQYAGSGLGLAITKSLVELMGGRIEVESEPGAGSKFTVYLDFEMIDNDVAIAEIDRNETLKTTATEALCGKNVLLCEDHPLNVEIAKRLLEKVSCNVTVAGNGAIGVERFRASEPGFYDAILMDIRMPEMDGLEAARTIRAMERDDAGVVPIIAMTANAFEDDVQNSIRAGMNAHLAKPIEPPILYRALIMNMQEYRTGKI